MSTLTQRLITGITGAFILFVGMLWNIYSFSALMLLVVILGTIEFNKLVPKAGAEPHKFPAIIIGALLLIIITPEIFSFIPFYKSLNLLVAVIAILSLIRELFRRKPNPFANLSFMFWSVIYIALPCALAINISNMSEVYSAFPILGFFLLIWSNDTGAYFAGNFFGKTKLFERISPNKTWEGTIGGAVLSLIFATLIAKYSGILSITHWLVISVLVTITGNYGDLLQSLFKRSIDVKDSGTLLPGHGGFLDRFDSFFLVIPAIYVYLKVVQLF